MIKSRASFDRGIPRVWEGCEMNTENLKGSDHIGDLGADGRIILKLILTL
jgi:hypothetical protein